MNISFLKNIIKNNNVSNSQIMNLNKSRLQKNKLANNFSAADDFAYFNAMKNYNISFSLLCQQLSGGGYFLCWEFDNEIKAKLVRQKEDKMMQI